MNLPLSALLLLSLALPSARLLGAADNPRAALEEIKKLRLEGLNAARATGKISNPTSFLSNATARARSAVAGVDPAKVEAADASAWQELFSMAGDYRGARAATQRWLASAQGEEKFQAQMNLLNTDARLKDYRAMRQTFLEAQPTDATGRLRLALLANTFAVNILTNEGPAAALQVLKAGERALQGAAFTEVRQKDQAKWATEGLAESRKAIEENPGKEADALLKARRAQLPSLATAAAAGGATNSSTAERVAAARAERDARLAKLNGTAAPAIKAARTLGDFQGLPSLQGKVVLLDFFAHWCGPCIASLPSLRELHDELKSKGFEVVGVTRFYGYYKTENRAARDMTPEKEFDHMKEFTREQKMSWPVVFTDKQPFEDYLVTGIPHVVLIDRAGKIRKVKVGFSKDAAAAFHEEVRKLVAEQP